MQIFLVPKELFDKKPKATPKKNEVNDEEVSGSRRPRRSAANAARALVQTMGKEEDEQMVL